MTLPFRNKRRKEGQRVGKKEVSGHGVTLCCIMDLRFQVRSWMNDLRMDLSMQGREEILENWMSGILNQVGLHLPCVLRWPTQRPGHEHFRETCRYFYYTRETGYALF